MAASLLTNASLGENYDRTVLENRREVRGSSGRELLTLGVSSLVTSFIERRSRQCF
jgi:hypothetical protein